MKNYSLVLQLCLFFLASSTFTSAQGIYKVSLDEKVKNAALVIEGKVVSQESFWNPEHTMIFTANKVEVYKVFKGKIIESFVEVITQGGTVGTMFITTSELLTLKPKDVGVFFCLPDKFNVNPRKSGAILYDVYSSKQGFIKYDLVHGKASTPFEEYKDIEKGLYTEIKKKTGKAIENKNLTFSTRALRIQSAQQVLAPTITSFTPSLVHAGALLDPANNLLTINGSGFGTPSGSAAVQFDDANNGSGSTPYSIPYNDVHVVSWTDNQIQIRVPTEAGSGNFSVVDASGANVTSPAPLTVLFSVLTRYQNFSGTILCKEYNLMNRNGLGGYTISYSNNTAGGGIDVTTSPIMATFQRALTTWKESAGANLREGGATTQQTVQYDGINLVTLDNTNSGVPLLPAGTLGVCYTFGAACNSGSEVQNLEFDIVIRNQGVSVGSTAFTIGPCPPLSSNYTETDLETVLLHELGHALNLGHVNDSYEGGTIGALNPGKIMNYALVNSVKRTSLDFSAKSGALYTIAPQSNAYGTCFGIATEMTPLATIVETKDECPISFPASATPSGTIVDFNLAHATSNLYGDPQYTRVKCDGSGTAVTNNAYYAFRTGSHGGNLSLGIGSYTNSPAAISGCTQAYSYPVQGVRLAVYQVAACPLGQSFPTPIACRTFAGNGPLSDLTGLSPNTTYLIYVDGIENTKANFSLTVGGLLLPRELKTFNGKTYEAYNELLWESDNIGSVSKMAIQRSSDGASFEHLSDVSSVQFSKGFFRDLSPLDGNNYYRLLIANENGKKEYSKVVLLQRADIGQVQVFPNPVSEQLHITIKPGPIAHTIELYNTNGQIILRKEIAAGTGSVDIPVSSYSRGLYQLQIRNKKGLVANRKIRIQ